MGSFAVALLGGVTTVIGLIAISAYSSLRKRRQERYQSELRKAKILEWIRWEKGFSDETIKRLKSMELQQIQFTLIQQSMLDEQEMDRMMQDPYLN